MRWREVPVRFSLFVSPSDAKLVWTMHHALRCVVSHRSVSPHSDGWTLDLLGDDLQALCNGDEPAERPSFARFVQWWTDREVSGEAQKFWADYLDSPPDRWPRLPPGTTPSTSRVAERAWSGDSAQLQREHGLTLAIASRVAFALALGRCAGAADVLFGVVRSGRDVALPDCDAVIGPCVSALPCRIRFDGAETVLDAVKAETQADRTCRRHQAVRLSEIGGRGFSTLFTYQSLAVRAENEAPRPITEPPERITMPTSYALSVEATPSKTGLALHCYHDESIVSVEQAERLLEDMAGVLDVMMSGGRVADFVEASAAAGEKPRTAESHPSGGKLDMIIAERVRKCWLQVLKTQSVELDDSFLRVGGDSVRRCAVEPR